MFHLNRTEATVLQLRVSPQCTRGNPSYSDGSPYSHDLKNRLPHLKSAGTKNDQ